MQHTAAVIVMQDITHLARDLSKPIAHWNSGLDIDFGIYYFNEGSPISVGSTLEFERENELEVLGYKTVNLDHLMCLILITNNDARELFLNSLTSEPNQLTNA